ncbi:hypothetical protein IFM89_027665 [Coptis chinensis]|uniref:Retrotransposon Copia-like N-terminal domain-containing protein n=1 Tax=Coptis chinensis TaxID=261450 RepID=A0A835J2H0_9MAGN|nr:hypothetical protein IFM89_027665 [Coptis chinensis]
MSTNGSTESIVSGTVTTATMPTFSIPTITNLVTVKLNDDNFLLWSHQIGTFLIGQDLYKFANGSYPCPTITDPGYNIWLRTDKTLVSILSATLFVPILSSVIGCQTSAAIWSRLQDYFSQRSVANSSQIRRNLNEISRVLCGLGSEYEMLITALESLETLPQFSNSHKGKKEYFQNKFVETIQFLEVLNLKDSVDKDAFFRKLPNLAEQLPRQIVLKKLLPLLASSLDFGSAVAPALTALLKMGSWFSTEEYSVKVYPHVATGFSDTSAFLRELTLKFMLVLAPKVDEEPAIRTNTTILLGNITGFLNEGTRKRVLINAFTVRALCDTFSPARGAGVMALCATSSYYDTTEIATRILPKQCHHLLLWNVSTRVFSYLLCAIMTLALRINIAASCCWNWNTTSLVLAAAPPLLLQQLALSSSSSTLVFPMALVISRKSNLRIAAH